MLGSIPGSPRPLVACKATLWAHLVGLTCLQSPEDSGKLSAFEIISRTIRFREGQGLHKEMEREQPQTGKMTGRKITQVLSIKQASLQSAKLFQVLSKPVNASFGARRVWS